MPNIATDQDSVVAEIQIAAPPERVFQALIQPDQLVRWWSDADHKADFWEIDPTPGGRWRYATKGMPR